MKQLFIIAIAIITLSSCQQQKIAYLDNGKVINDYQEKIDMEAKYKIKMESYQKSRDSIGRAFQAEVGAFQAQEKTMSTKKKEELRQQLGQKQQRLQQQLQFEEQKISKEYQTEIDTLINKVKSLVSDYGKNNGYTYILGTSENNASVMYGKDNLDITEAVSKSINASYKPADGAVKATEEKTIEVKTEQ